MSEFTTAWELKVQGFSDCVCAVYSEPEEIGGQDVEKAIAEARRLASDTLDFEQMEAGEKRARIALGAQ